MTATSQPELKRLASQIRGELVEMSHRAGTAHLGSSLSCVDILVAAYWNILNLDPQNASDPNRDRFILSKGHAASALYATLAYRGFFPKEELLSFTQDGSAFPEHPAPRARPGIEAATGSLGHGLPIGLGLAMAAKIQNRPYRVYVLMSDGECNEGSVWEAAMLAPAQKISKLAVIIDYNKWQATGRSNEIMSLSSLREKWDAFGWDTIELDDGHDIAALTDAMRDIPTPDGKPLAIIANTVKGKGISFMEDDNNWHYRSPNAEEVQKAKKELGLV